MEFNELTDTQIRHLVDLRQIYEAWHASKRDLAHKFAGSMFWRTVGGADYLKRKIGQVEKSLGRRSPETEEIHGAFARGREAARERHDSLAKAVDLQASIARTVGLGRVPPIVARLLRRLDDAELLGHIRVVGTNAMFAYEALAGVMFSADALATGDIDLLIDARRQLKILVDDGTERTVMGLLQSIDHSFEKVAGRAYRAINKDGFMVDLIRPEPRPAWKTEPGGQALAESDLDPSPIEGLQWLVNSPAVSALVIDGRGFPAPIVVPDPRIWLLHKKWLSKRGMRDPEKKQRDLRQAQILWDLVPAKLPQYPIDPHFLNSLPAPLKEAGSELAGIPPEAAVSSENWTPRPPSF
jgi:hypothetical protein